MWVRDAGLAETEAVGDVEWRRGWRRRLGPAAWVVLEELCDNAGGGGEAHVSVRSLAGVLGLDKDTVARALRRLSSAGLVVAGSQRRDGGRFGPGTYRVLPGSATGPSASSTPMTTPSPRARRKSPAGSRSGRPAPGGQQSLFDHDDLLDSVPRHHQRPPSGWSSTDLV